MASAPLTGIHSLSTETLVSIFSLLPIADLARCAAVCERWHGIVTGFPHLWKGTTYRSERSPRESGEVYAVLRALPPLRELVVKYGEFCIHVSYPCLFLTVRDVADTGSAEVGVFAQFLSDDRLDTSVGIGRLQVISIECPGLKELTFLRRYSDVLRKLELKHCVNLPSAAYARLGQLGSLQSLRLRNCNVEAADLEVAAQGMRSLASLRLEFCDLTDLSWLRHCERLRDLRVKESPPPTGLRALPAGLRSLHLEEVATIPAGELSNLRHLVRLEVLKLVDCSVDADVICRVLPSLTRLHTLSLSRMHIDHLQFLRSVPQLHTLSLYDTVGFQQEAYLELLHLSNLQILDVSLEVHEFVRGLLRSFLPNLTFRAV